MESTFETILNFLYIVLALNCSIAILVVSLYITQQAKIARLLQLRKVLNREFIDNINRLSEYVQTDEIQGLMKVLKDRKPIELIQALDQIYDLKEKLKYQDKSLQSFIELAMNTISNEVIGKIYVHIKNNDKLIKRMDEFKSSKLYIKEHYFEIPDIQEAIKYDDAIFIESGSTLSYLVLDLIEKFKNNRIKEFNPETNEERVKPLIACTNNVIIYMILLFEPDIIPILLPGRPTNQYGATFGIQGKENECNPDAVKGFLEKHKVTTLFTTASYLDMDYGPHVSSLANKKMKSALYEYMSEKPECKNFLIIVSEKINNDVSQGLAEKQCKLIFDKNDNHEIPNDPTSLEIIKDGFQSFLKKPNNFIITGTTDVKYQEDFTKNISNVDESLFFVEKKNEGILKYLHHRVKMENKVI